MTINAFSHNIPEKTFAKLNREGEFTRLAVSPGIINKHYTPAQFQTIAEVVGARGAIKYSASYSILLSIPTIELTTAKRKLEKVGLYIAKQGQIVAMKACDFCDGDKMEAAQITEELYQQLEGLEVPSRICINMNGCASACYNAVYDDIGLVYQKDSFDVYLGAVPMGKHAQAGELFMKKVSVQHIENLLQEIIRVYQERAYQKEPFYKFYKRTKDADFWQTIKCYENSSADSSRV
ncbi:precorrin-3B methylase [Lysinibacillus sp. CNPSo 3705]|uniref:precorrin-3B methylase n=1 Tax=Lysinibacillus sp. CNPSo 3705 TaxID=3028148 RepID=UPI0010F2805E|nr:precorrin-3B methylase [Lysinibacillus sp. CNPSo 3705]MDD1502795.1 precorrin-3B methylase [Lysinibacillus sp. CNPSo 3705]